MRVFSPLLLLLLGSSGGASDIQCDQFSEACNLVDSFYGATKKGGDAFNSTLLDLLKEPLGTACWLVRGVQPVKSTKFSSDQLLDVKARPIWALRGLRFITKCTDYKAPLLTKQMVDPRDLRWNLLLQNGIQEIPFFRTWMSREVVVVAPPEVQEQIIASWQHWYARDAAAFAFERCDAIDAWYF